MALNAATVWEVRGSGNNNNGGGWHDAGGASADYSQQDAAELSVADAVANGTTTITSATGGFTAAMNGNIVYILTKGRYEICGCSDTNTITVDRNVAAGSGLTANVGGAVADLEEIDSIVVAGNVIHVKTGTYNLAGAISIGALIGLEIRGYKDARDDEPEGDDRPLFACGANGFTCSIRGLIEYVRWTTTNAAGITLLNYATVRHCKCENTSTGDCFTAGTAYTFIDVEMVPGSSGYGIDTAAGANPTIMYCYFHDGAYGLKAVGAGGKFTHNTFDTLTKGMDVTAIAAAMNNLVEYNNFYNCTEGIASNQLHNAQVIYNNQFVSCAEGMDLGGNSTYCYIDYNNWYNNGTDIVDSNVDKGPHATAIDPGYKDAGGGDFSEVDTADALSMALGVG